MIAERVPAFNLLNLEVNMTLQEGFVPGSEEDLSWIEFDAQTQVKAYFIVIIECLITLCSIAGNLLVIGAVASSNALRASVTNYFVASLAVADLTVALCVMPFAIVQDWRAAIVYYNDFNDDTSVTVSNLNTPRSAVLVSWIFCYFWMSCDVMCCTASILNLCIISIDRYLAITEPLSYPTRMSARVAGLAIGAAWACSGAISFIPIYSGWFADQTRMTLYTDLADCGLHVNAIYAVVSSMTSFYVPLCVMIVVYAKIYLVASRQANTIARQERSLMSSQSRLAGTGLDSRDEGGSSNGPEGTDTRRRYNRDRKAIKTLGTIMGLFCFCWLPFFLLYLIKPFCTSCHVPYWVTSSITWLGYVNSGINPFVYALMNKDFRNAYSRLLFCGKGNRFKSSMARRWTKNVKNTKSRPVRSHNSFDSDCCLNKSKLKLGSCPAIHITSACSADWGKNGSALIRGDEVGKEEVGATEIANNYSTNCNLSSSERKTGIQRLGSEPVNNDRHELCESKLTTVEVNVVDS